MFTAHTLCEGRWPMAVLAGLSAAGVIWCWPAGLVAGALLVFTIYFFRDPERAISADPQAIVAPADGKVVDIETVNEPQFLGGPATRVGIFMSVFNVHVQRAPIAGEVKLLRYQPGKFLDARRQAAARLNENQLIGIEAADGFRVTVRQIAGRIARRVVAWVREGTRLEPGQRLGMIRFGSRVELFLTAGTKTTARVGEYVKGGETVLARRRCKPNLSSRERPRAEEISAMERLPCVGDGMSTGAKVTDLAGSIYRTADLNWQELRGFPGTADVKLLRVDMLTGAKTMLVKLPAGGRIYPHTHDRAVQHYVTEGAYESNGQAFRAGTYRLIPQNIETPLITTERGVVFLLLSDPTRTAAMPGAAT